MADVKLGTLYFDIQYRNQGMVGGNGSPLAGGGAGGGGGLPSASNVTAPGVGGGHFGGLRQQFFGFPTAPIPNGTVYPWGNYPWPGAGQGGGGAGGGATPGARPSFQRGGGIIDGILGGWTSAMMGVMFPMWEVSQIQQSQMMARTQGMMASGTTEMLRAQSAGYQAMTRGPMSGMVGAMMNFFGHAQRPEFVGQAYEAAVFGSETADMIVNRLGGLAGQKASRETYQDNTGVQVELRELMADASGAEAALKAKRKQLIYQANELKKIIKGAEGKNLNVNEQEILDAQKDRLGVTEMEITDNVLQTDFVRGRNTENLRNFVQKNSAQSGLNSDMAKMYSVIGARGYETPSDRSKMMRLEASALRGMPGFDQNPVMVSQAARMEAQADMFDKISAADSQMRGDMALELAIRDPRGARRRALGDELKRSGAGSHERLWRERLLEQEFGDEDRLLDINQTSRLRASRSRSSSGFAGSLYEQAGGIFAAAERFRQGGMDDRARSELEIGINNFEAVQRRIYAGGSGVYASSPFSVNFKGGVTKAEDSGEIIRVLQDILQELRGGL